jgi:hypothetical protein
MKKSDLINTRLITTIAELNVAKDEKMHTYFSTSKFIS